MFDLKLDHISPSVWAVTDGSTAGNVGCIKLQNQIIVIDTTITPVAAASFRQLINEQVGTNITNVILTHIHSDHTFGAQEFTNCRLISSKAMAKLYPQFLQERWSKLALRKQLHELSIINPERAQELEQLTIIQPTMTFEHSMTLGEKEEILIQHTGGHTVGQSIVYFHPEKILFASDLLFCQTYPYAGDPTNDPRKWILAFETILEMPVDKIIPGHGPVCDKGEVQKHLDYFRNLETWILDKLKENLDVDSVVKLANDSPKPPYIEDASRPSFGEGRLKGTIRRWFEYYQASEFQ